MPDYIEYPLGADAETMLSDWLAELRTYWPNFDPAEGSLAFRSAAALVRIIAEGLDLAQLVPAAIFRYLGRNFFNVPSFDAIPAQADTNWTMVDTLAHDTIPAGTVVSISGTLFATTDDLVIPGGATVYGPVTVQAIEEGAAANDLGGPGVPIDLEEPYAYVSAVTMVSATQNGQDEESNDEYQNRLATRLTLLTPRAITTKDLAVMAQTISGVDAALALKGYNPADDTWDNPGYAAVALRNAAGLAVTADTKDAVSAAILGPDVRLLNSVLNIIDPTWTAVGVTYDAYLYPGSTSDPALAKIAGDGAVSAVLDPAAWGLPKTGETKRWYNKQFIRISDIVGALEAIEMLDYVDKDSVMITVGAGPAVNDDVELPGVAPIPTPGDIDGTVHTA